MNSLPVSEPFPEIRAKLIGYRPQKLRCRERPRPSGRGRPLLQDKILDLESRIAIHEDRIKSGNVKLHDLESHYKKEIAKEKKHADLLARLQLCEEGLKLLEKIKTEIVVDPILRPGQTPVPLLRSCLRTCHLSYHRYRVWILHTIHMDEIC